MRELSREFSYESVRLACCRGKSIYEFPNSWLRGQHDGSSAKLQRCHQYEATLLHHLNEETRIRKLSPHGTIQLFQDKLHGEAATGWFRACPAMQTTRDTSSRQSFDCFGIVTISISTQTPTSDISSQLDQLEFLSRVGICTSMLLSPAPCDLEIFARYKLRSSQATDAKLCSTPCPSNLMGEPSYTQAISSTINASSRTSMCQISMRTGGKKEAEFCDLEEE